MYEIFDGQRYGILYFALSVSLRIELSLYIIDYLYFTVYLAVPCWHNVVFNSLFIQPS